MSETIIASASAIAGDDPVRRELPGEIVVAAPGWNLVGSFRSGEAALKPLPAHPERGRKYSRQQGGASGKSAA